MKLETSINLMKDLPMLELVLEGVEFTRREYMDNYENLFHTKFNTFVNYQIFKVVGEEEFEFHTGKEKTTVRTVATDKYGQVIFTYNGKITEKDVNFFGLNKEFTKNLQFRVEIEESDIVKGVRYTYTLDKERLIDWVQRNKHEVEYDLKKKEKKLEKLLRETADMKDFLKMIERYDTTK